jgi:hypothetical protein
MQFKGPVAAWVLDEDSARIFAAGANVPTVEEYDPVTGKLLRQFEIGDKASRLLIKGKHLVAAIPSQSALYIVDLETNQVAGQIELDRNAPCDMCCSKVNNPYVYVCSTARGTRRGSLLQVDYQRAEGDQARR